MPFSIVRDLNAALIGYRAYAFLILEFFNKTKLRGHVVKNFGAIDTKKNRPTFLKGAIKNWPAVQKWDADYLAGLAQGIEGKLIAGQRETESFAFKKMDLSVYFSQNHQQALYLKEFDLLKSLPTLKKDIDLSAFTLPLRRLASRAWIGKPGTKTGLHYDLLNNVLFHIAGEKHVYLLDKKYSRHVPRSQRFDVYARIGELDLSDATFIKKHHPELAPHIINYVLEPGDALFIPKGCWHQVFNPSFTISLSGFFITPAGLPIIAMEETRKLAHHLKLLKVDNCTCHA